MKWLIACLLALVMVTPALAGEDPYIAVVGNDINANAFYLSPKHVQFLHDQTIAAIPVTGEVFTANSAIIQPEICDTTGIAAGPQNGPPFTFRGNFNGRITAGNAGWYEWVVRLPKKPSGEINLCIQCGLLKPNAFTFLGFESVLDCAAETGERIGDGLCVREEVNPGENPLVTAALPKVFARALPGPYAPVAFTPFTLTAFRNPGTYEPFESGGILANGAAGQVLDGLDDASRILLKSCMDKCIVVKLPVTGQVNALGQIEYDLEAGDLINVRMNIPRPNTVDVYCHQESLKLMGVGEASF
ncbi:MAG: hypothetical protein EHM36_01180 [Deltaproteobacteria bacterium]|nr:MAG: hypothetical protein EHM36_01180 [Deltaproteobacteria bacterium]